MIAPPVHEQPTFDLYDWIIVESHDGYHLVGRHSDRFTVRISTPIVVFDINAMTCKTQSGRRYQLMSPRASEVGAQYLLAQFMRLESGDVDDATESVLRDPSRIGDSCNHPFRSVHSGRPEPLLSHLVKMSSDPESWIPQLSDELARCDVDPSLHYKCLDLSEHEWSLWCEGQLEVVPIQTSLRGQIVRELLDTLYYRYGSQEQVTRWMHTHIPGICTDRTMKEIILDGDIEALITVQILWADVEPTLASQ